MSANDNEEECRREPKLEEEMDLRPGRGKEWEEWWIPKVERLLEMRPTGGEWDG